jgi:hypothetical protein
VSATDSTFASGFGGLLVFDDTSAGSGLTDATFDNYVAVVPEPSLIALLALGLTLVGFQARRLKAPRA